MKVTGGLSKDWGPIEAHRVSYTRFRRRIIQKSAGGGPAASTPLATWRQREPRFELHAVRQRLELDSPPRLRGPHRETAHPPRSFPVLGRPAPENTPQQGWVWKAAVPEHAGSALQPFALLDKTFTSQRGKSVMKLAAPSLLNDYYTHLLDCSCKGVIALALGSSVYLWNSQTGATVGSLDPSPRPGLGRHQTASISCLSWSRDGSVLCIGSRRGEIQLWDVEHKRNMGCLPSHLSVVRALSWKQNLLSSGSALGRIHHLDPRAPEPLVGAVAQEEEVCGLQWSPGGDRLASGSTQGLLCIWGGDMAGVTWSRQPISTMRQPSAVKAMGWCPWQSSMIATGGGWKDGELRIWDTDSGTCVTSANTNSQICSLRWAQKKKCLVTGHGLPHHQVSCWSCPRLPALGPVYLMSGHASEIIGGTEVEPHSLPFMVLIQKQRCGGILIHPSWVLTAAHCNSTEEVLLGVHSKEKGKKKESNSRQLCKVKKTFVHPCYDATDKVNDVMLLKLNKPAKQTKTVKCLPLDKAAKDPAAGTSCKVAGWGSTKNRGQGSDVLMAANVTVIDRVKCNSADYYALKPIITRSMICAGSHGNNRVDTCQGDSGGPLLCNGALVGVTSFGTQCGILKKPGVYSFLSENTFDWIKKTIKKSEI
ncbi:uncharacterized protein AB9W97_014028 isoform 2-T2 [Spinachia spinachia]